MLVKEDGQNMTKGICCNVNPIECVEDKYLGKNHVGVLIMKPIEGMMDMGVMFSLRIWPLSRVFHNGCTIAHHLLVSAHKLRAKSKVMEKWRKEGKNGL